MTSVPEEDDMEDHEYVPKQYLAPHLIKQSELNDLRRELKLSKKDADILGSRLQHRNLLASDTVITFYRQQNDFIEFFT